MLETPAEGEGPKAVALTTAKAPPGEAPTTPKFNSPAGDEAPTPGEFTDAPAEGPTPTVPAKVQIPVPTDTEIKIPAAPAIPAEAEVHTMSKEDENPLLLPRLLQLLGNQLRPRSLLLSF